MKGLISPLASGILQFSRDVNLIPWFHGFVVTTPFFIEPAFFQQHCDPGAAMQNAGWD